ncbi:MAG: cell envelope integrity protein TolA [Nitrospiraceae bacterium]|nr:cell envelope integrity protein TolA [Nitrospiraceae bacterium]
MPKVKAPDHAGYKQPDKSDHQDQEALNDWMALHEGIAGAEHRVKIRTEIKVGSNDNPPAGPQNASSEGLYADRLKGCISKYVIYPDMGEGNKVIVDITILNDGVLPCKIVRSSGNPKFDSAVAAAINRAGECAGPPPANYYKTILEATIHQ